MRASRVWLLEMLITVNYSAHGWVRKTMLCCRHLSPGGRNLTGCLSFTAWPPNLTCFWLDESWGGQTIQPPAQKKQSFFCLFVCFCAAVSTWVGLIWSLRHRWGNPAVATTHLFTGDLVEWSVYSQMPQMLFRKHIYNPVFSCESITVQVCTDLLPFHD